jgi:type IV pilus assembly protein PilV
MKLRHQNAGVSLVESLVALVVISIGMLGIAALHVESLRSGRTALLRSQAVVLASGMADQIRANRGNNGEYGNAAITVANVDAKCKPGGTGCTPIELARHDKALWLTDLAARLPGGSGIIEYDNTTVPVTYKITITWTEQQGGSQTYILRLRA